MLECSQIGRYYFPIKSLGVDNKVLLTHMRAFDALRLINKAGVVDRTTYDAIVGALIEVIAMRG